MDQMLKYGRSLREFSNTSNQHVFVEAESYPDFFNKFLNHPSRKLKVFLNDPNANIRAFYFQFLILCYEIDESNATFYRQKLYSYLMDPNFNFIFLEEDDEQIFNDLQFKRFLLQFMNIWESGQFMAIDDAIDKYPIIDVVFVYFFRTLLIYGQVTNNYDQFIDKDQLFNFLLQTFNVDAAIYEEKCLKFFQAEVFLYEENSQQIYMAYMGTDQHIAKSIEEEDDQQLKQEDKIPQQKSTWEPKQTYEEVKPEKLNETIPKYANLELQTHHTSLSTTVQQLPSPNKYSQQIFYEPKITKSVKAHEKNFEKAIMNQLNITKEFTDSLLLKEVAEPHRSGIQRIKTRSREYRNSLIRTFK